MVRMATRALLVALHVAAVVLLGASAPAHAAQLLDRSASQKLDTGSHLRSLNVFFLRSLTDNDLDLAIPASGDTSLEFGEPIVVEAEGEARGAAIMLHGLTNTGQEHLDSTATLRAAVPGVKWIYPTSPEILGAQSWYGLDGLDEDAGDLEECISYIQGLIDAEVEAGTPASQIFVGGYSQGGSVALAGLRSFDSLAGIIGMASWVPRRDDDPLVTESMQSVPVLMTHGALDYVVPLPLARAGYDDLQDAGANIEFETYFTMTHEMRSDMLEDVAGWMDSILG